MRLALRELRRRPGRFVSAAAILTLIALLLMFLGGLLDGLIRSSTGAVRAQDADAIVYSATSQSSFLRSRIDPDQRATVEGVEGVEEVGGIGIVQLGARVPGNGPRDLAAVAVFGYELAPSGVPDPPEPGQAYADDVLRADGITEGMEILLGPARTPVEVIGFVSDTSYAGQGGLWVEASTWRAVLDANSPSERLGDGVFQALVVRTDGSTDDLVDAIDEATGGATASLGIAEAVDAIPGVSEQTATFNQIIGVTIAIAVTVIALFFALLTVERTALYGVLKALGARSSTLLGGLVLQAVIVTSIAATLAAVVAFAIDAIVPAGGIPLDVTMGRVLSSIALLLLAAVVGCTFSFRRVLKVDPASAIGTAS